jgi:hypothetical protein
VRQPISVYLSLACPKHEEPTPSAKIQKFKKDKIQELFTTKHSKLEPSTSIFTFYQMTNSTPFSCLVIEHVICSSTHTKLYKTQKIVMK